MNRHVPILGRKFRIQKWQNDEFCVAGFYRDDKARLVSRINGKGVLAS
ncbi:hypothetical protein TH47_02125 [Thalassospira sp. MCCC 1A02803]|nr:hypothetical protein TH47_02125 [Thalassospira sp. MCCC 1A02803]